PVTGTVGGRCWVRGLTGGHLSGGQGVGVRLPPGSTARVTGITGVRFVRGEEVRVRLPRESTGGIASMREGQPPDLPRRLRGSDPRWTLCGRARRRGAYKHSEKVTQAPATCATTFHKAVLLGEQCASKTHAEGSTPSHLAELCPWPSGPGTAPPRRTGG